MPVPATTPRLRIDEMETDFGEVWLHAQDDPYPGGHRYSLWLPDSMARDWLSHVGLEPGRRYDGVEHLSRDGLFWLAAALACWRMGQERQEAKPWLFVLNTITQVVPGNQGVEVRGVCSPFVRGDHA